MRRTSFSIAGLMGFVLIVAVGFGALKAADPLWSSACYSVAFVALVAGALLTLQTRGRKRAYWAGFSLAGWAYFFVGFQNPDQFQDQSPWLITSIWLQKAEELMFPGRTSAITISYNALSVTPPAILPMPVPVSPPAPPRIAVSSPAETSHDTTNALPNVVVESELLTKDSATVATISPVPPPPLPIMPTPPTPIAVTPPGWLMQSPESSFQHVGQSMLTLLFAYVGGWFSLFLASRREQNESNPPAEISPPSP